MPAVTGYEALQERLCYVFRDPALLQLALTHPSVAHEHNAALETNQRLEFLGDAVLQLVLTRELYEKFPAFDEWHAGDVLPAPRHRTCPQPGTPLHPTNPTALRSSLALA